jgi:hypothetical protein
MMENGKRRARRQLSPEEKWEVFLEVICRSSPKPTRLGGGAWMCR